MSRDDPATPVETNVRYLMSRLRWAESDDIDALCGFYQELRPDEANGREAMADWIEHGGAMLLDDEDDVILAALRWREADDGWRVDRIASRPAERGKGYGRWLMTKVEALAIRSNVPNLTMVLGSTESLPYYYRLGYRPVRETLDCTEIRKRVGGKWQVQEEHP